METLFQVIAWLTWGFMCFYLGHWGGETIYRALRCRRLRLRRWRQGRGDLRKNMELQR